MDFIAAHNRRVCDLSFSAWMGTAALVLAILLGLDFSGKDLAYATANVAFLIGATWNVGTFFAYLTNVGRAEREFKKEHPDV